MIRPFDSYICPSWVENTNQICCRQRNLTSCGMDARLSGQSAALTRRRGRTGSEVFGRTADKSDGAPILCPNIRKKTDGTHGQASGSLQVCASFAPRSNRIFVADRIISRYHTMRSVCFSCGATCAFVVWLVCSRWSVCWVPLLGQSAGCPCQTDLKIG